MINKCTQVFKALSDETRQKILEMLEQRDMCVSELVNKLKSSQPTISHHLNILKYAGLVIDRREGQKVTYSLNGNWLKECCKDYFSMFKCCKELFTEYEIVKKTKGKKK